MRYIVNLCFIFYFLSCSSSNQGDSANVELNGTIVNQFGEPIADALIQVIETIHITNLTDNNNGFEKHQNILASIYSSKDGSFSVEVSSTTTPSLKEIMVRRDPFLTYRIPISLNTQILSEPLVIELKTPLHRDGQENQFRISLQH